ncbi:MAG: hypothetical protein JO328_00735 [Hyphomicrobiales bacterium]|nr:hypothetical protein [Hyphomicrobiales bacterium]MBV8824225.1 hypothetical protein [Hyphomicrobiales bacterium]MBV9429298.1 hypothetical protein [Bradyrhizobiaceae bacterium]
MRPILAYFLGLTVRNNGISFDLGVEVYRCNENRRGDLNDWKRPYKGQGCRDSWFGCRRRSGDLRRGHYWHPDRHNGWSIHSGVDHFRYARRRLVASWLGLARLGLAARMGLAARLAPLVSPI